MSLNEEISNFFNNAIERIADKDTSDKLSLQLSNDFTKTFGNRVDGVSRIESIITGEQFEPKTPEERRKDRRKERRQELRDEIIDSGEFTKENIKEFIDDMRSLDRETLRRGRVGGWIFLNNIMLPMVTQSINIKHTYENPYETHQGEDKDVDQIVEEGPFTEETLNKQARALGTQNALITVTGIIPHGSNVSAHMRLRFIVRLYEAIKDALRPVIYFIWNPTINSSDVNAVIMKSLDIGDKAEHDSIEITLEMKQDLRNSLISGEKKRFVNMPLLLPRATAAGIGIPQLGKRVAWLLRPKLNSLVDNDLLN